MVELTDHVPGTLLRLVYVTTESVCVLRADGGLILRVGVHSAMHENGTK